MCENFATGNHDFALTSLGREQGSASTLDLSKERVRTVKANIQQLWRNCVVDFPSAPQEPMGAIQAPSAQIDNGAPGRAITVRASSRIESEEEYNIRKAVWMSECEKEVEESGE